MGVGENKQMLRASQDIVWLGGVDGSGDVVIDNGPQGDMKFSASQDDAVRAPQSLVGNVTFDAGSFGIDSSSFAVPHRDRG